MTTKTQYQEKNISVTSSKKEEAKVRLQNLMKEEMTTVKGIFKNYECPGGSAHICVKKYPNTEVFDRWLEDGKAYEMPLYVARHLNGIDRCAIDLGGVIHSCAYPIHSYAVDQNGKSRIDAGTYRQRYGFMSLDFAA